MSEVILGEDLKTAYAIGQAGIATAKPYYANWLAGASQLAPAVRLEPFRVGQRGIYVGLSELNHDHPN